MRIADATTIRETARVLLVISALSDASGDADVARRCTASAIELLERAAELEVNRMNRSGS